LTPLPYTLCAPISSEVIPDDSATAAIENPARLPARRFPARESTG